MNDIQKAIDALTAMRTCEKGGCDGECSSCEHFEIQCEDLIFTYDAAIAALQEKQHNDELRQKGRLVELPCAIGDMVYRICPKCNDHHDGSCVGCAWQFSASHRGCDVYGLWKDGQYHPEECTIVPYKVEWNYIPNLLEHIGKTAFLTPEAAQEALKKMEKAEGRS